MVESLFLMYRVELKEKNRQEETMDLEKFLMYRVELKVKRLRV